MIKNCFIDDDQAKFYRDVMLDGVKIAKVHALTRNDEAAIEEVSWRRRMIKGNMEVDLNSNALLVIRMFRSLTGETEAGWEINRPITLENVGKLDRKTFTAINDVILELKEQNAVTKDVSKN